MIYRPEWADTKNLGSPPPGLLAASRLAGAQNQNSYLEVFCVGTDGAVWHIWETGNSSWSPWASLGAPPGIRFNSGVNATDIRVASNADGRLEVFISDDQYDVWHIWQDAPNSNWVNQWSGLGKPPARATSYNMKVVTNEVQQLEVFLIDTGTGVIYSKNQTAPNGGWEAYWTSLGAPPVVGNPTVVDFQIAAPNRTLTQQVVALGADGNIWRNERTRFVGGNWSGWSGIINAPNGVKLTSLPALTENQDRRLELLAFSDWDELWHTWQSAPGAWSGSWENFKQPASGTRHVFAMGLDYLGQLMIVTWGRNPPTVQQMRQTAPNNGWSGWAAIRPKENVNEYETDTLVLVKKTLSATNDPAALNNVLWRIFSQGDGQSIFCIPQHLQPGGK